MESSSGRIISSYSELELLATLNGCGVAEYASQNHDRFVNLYAYAAKKNTIWGILRPDGTFGFFGPDGNPRGAPHIKACLGTKIGSLVKILRCDHVTIPDCYTSIGDYAFHCCSGLKSVTIPDSVTSIGDCAFDTCRDLTSVTIPDSVTYIGESAFECCSGLTSTTIGNGVTSIGAKAFYGCSGLMSVAIPVGVTSIESYAFSYCSALKSVTMPDSVTSIGDCVFSGCSRLTNVTIPDSVTNIGECAFYGCRRNIRLRFAGKTMKQVMGMANFPWAAKPDSITT